MSKHKKGFAIDYRDSINGILVSFLFKLITYCQPPFAFCLDLY